MQSQIDAIKDMIEEVLGALNGNKITQKGGLVTRVNTLEEKVERLEKKTDKMGWDQKLVHWAVGAVTMGVVNEIIQKVFNQD